MSLTNVTDPRIQNLFLAINTVIQFLGTSTIYGNVEKTQEIKQFCTGSDFGI